MMKKVTRYPLSVILLHWLVAVALIGNLFIGLMLDDHENLIALHKSIGILILGLAAVRLANRLRARHMLPRSINAVGTAARFAEKAVHHVLYVLMVAIPLLGWMKTNAAGHAARFFGFFLYRSLSNRAVIYRSGWGTSLVSSIWLGCIGRIARTRSTNALGFEVKKRPSADLTFPAPRQRRRRRL